MDELWELFAVKRFKLLLGAIALTLSTYCQSQFFDQFSKADEYLDQRDWESAIEILEEIYSQYGNSPATLEYSTAVCNLGYAYWELGDLDRAKNYLVEGINIKRGLSETHDVSYSTALRTLGQVLQYQGSFDQARIFLQESVNVIEINFGKNNHDYVVALGELANFLNVTGSYSDAYNLYLQAHQISTLIHDENTPEYAEVCASLGRISTKNGEFVEAEKYLQTSIEIYKDLGEEYVVEYAEALESLGVLFEVEGKYADSERILLQTLEIKQNIPNLDEQLLIETLNDLGILYQHLGNLEKAEDYFTQVHDRCLISLGKEHSYYGVAINNLAAIAEKKEEFEKARTLFAEALQIYQRVYGKNHPLYADALNNLASTESELGLYDDAQQNYNEVVVLDRVIYGENHPHYATTLNNYGILLFRKGDHHLAEDLYLEALKIRKNSLGENHPAYARTLENIGLYYYAENKPLLAEEYFREAIEVQKDQIKTVFPALTENERQAFYETINYDIERYNHVAIELAGNDPSIIGYVLNNQIQTKAILLNTSEKVRRGILNSGDNQLVEDYKQWTFLKNKLVRYYHVGIAKMAEYGLNVEELEEEIDVLEKKIVNTYEDFDILPNVNVTWQQIQQKLEPGEAVVEVLKIRDFDQNEIDKNLIFGFSEESSYLAIIIKSGNAPLEYVLMESGLALEQLHYLYYSNSLKYQITDLDSYKYFWKEIDKKLKNIDQVYLSPDGIYHKINPNILRPSKDKFVIDNYYVNLITNCSDMIVGNGDSEEFKRAYLIGNPKFNLGNREEILNRLPGAKEEVSQISTLLKKDENWDVRIFTDDKATEARIKSYYQPRLLHIATHGFFADGQDAITSRLLPKYSHPLFKSGIYLAGVENSLESYNQGRPNDPYNDGVLTAYEAMNLNLDKTDIVILSACNTGLGDVENGQGVYGLQRAFMVAGARNLILSLEEVDDLATQKLMGYFYKYYENNDEINDALKKAQLEVRKEYEDPLVWGSFILIGTGRRS